ncbi:MAG: hypothetical protein WAN75_08320 [Xanthobacteraceae bacterium]|jgi:hypothetical protein
MRATLIVTLVLHFLSGVFWAGTTFALARTGANQTDQFFRPQMGAAVIVVATGGLLWYLVHPGSFGTTEQILAVGVFCAFVAAGVQGVSGGSALRKVSITDEFEASRLRHRVATGQRVAAAFLMLTVTCMAVARYA